MALVQSMRAINQRGKKQGSVTNSTDQEDKVSKAFLDLYCVSDRFWKDFYSYGMASNSDAR